MDYERDLGDVVETLRSVVARGRRCTLLIGAGCSESAGIPLAADFVTKARKKYDRSYRRATSDDYASVMAALSPAERRELIARSVDDAKINWAHIAIAELMKEGYVDRVLTTNFDPLVVRAAAMTGEYPAVYDFAASQAFNAADLPDNAVFHLHGQRAGFALMNTPEEVKRHSERMRPVFEDAGRGRCWLVVGYSGLNDPVFDHLANVPRFDDRLYWVGYRDKDPDAHVRERLLEGDKWAFYVRGYDADSFFIQLARQLERRRNGRAIKESSCFPPDYIGKPFTHLGKSLGQLTKYPVQLLGGRDIEMVVRQSRDDQRAAGARGSAGANLGAGARNVGVMEDIDITEATRKAIEQAKQSDEGDDSPLAAWARFLEGRYDKVLEIVKRTKRKGGAGDLRDLGEPAYWSFIEAAYAELEKSKDHRGDNWREHLHAAVRHFDAAARIKEDRRYGYEDWGAALMVLGKHEDAAEKFKAACAGGRNHRALRTWGWALRWHADTVGDPDDSAEIYEAAVGKYREASKLRKDAPTLNAWALLLMSQAKSASTQREAKTLYTRAIAKFEKAIEAGSGMSQTAALVNVALAMRDLADVESPERAFGLRAGSVDHLRRAAQSRPDDPDVQFQLGLALASDADYYLEGKEAADQYAETTKLWEAARRAWHGEVWLIANLALVYARSAQVVDTTEAGAHLATARRYLEAIEDPQTKARSSLRVGAYLREEAHLRALITAVEQQGWDTSDVIHSLKGEVAYQRDPRWLRKQIAQLEARAVTAPGP